MKRRGLLAATGIASAGGLVGRLSRAQPAVKMRIGLLLNNTPIADMTGPEPADRNVRAFLRGLRDLGLVVGRDIAIEPRSAQGRPERGPELLKELSDLKVDVIVTTPGPVLRAGKSALQGVAVVFIGASEPVSAGLVTSLARPGGNITGLTLDAGPTMGGKRLELLREVAPKASRVAVLLPGVQQRMPFGAELQAAARALGFELRPSWVDTAQDFDLAFEGMLSERVQAILAPQSGPVFGAMRRIIDFAASHRLPAIYELREYTLAGGLMSFGTDVADLFRRAAGYVERMGKGARPADLPVEQPTKFELLINLKTAKELSITVPQSLLLRADELIQ